MTKRYWLLLFLFSALLSCNSSSSYQPAGLRKLSPAELIELARHSGFPRDSVLYKDSAGNTLTQEDYLKLDRTVYTSDFYADQEGKIKEQVVRKATEEDIALWKQMEDAYKEGPAITLIPVDCAAIKSILQKVYEKDQKNRTDFTKINLRTDAENQQQVISLIEQCGFPTSEQVGLSGIQAIFLVIQHASPKTMEKYFPQIKQSAGRGDLGWGPVAMMEDRILINNGLKQKYGSQVTKKGGGPWELQPLEDPANVNQRRAQVGLGPIEEYLANFGIEFKP